ncbi:MAG: endonuclease/exonuclease/phosphatase family protein [Clostridia bacterium]|nr:endonuclease/exonuclease/phosphatase family protein [Clostridia bacterium]
MKKAIRFFSLALALLMLLPMLSVFPIKVRATEQTYDASRDGELLRTVNFAADEWKQSFYDNNNCDAVAAVSDDGASVGFTVTSNLYKRAIWGGFYPGAGVDVDEYEEVLGEALPMEPGAKYTMTFDLTLAHDNVSFGIMVDGNNALSIRGNGQSRWYEWNTVRVDNTSVENEKWTEHIANGTSRRDTHTFAVTVDYDAKTMALYVLDENDGRFYFCRSMTYDGSGVWDSDYFRCRFSVRSIGGTPDETYTAEIANLNIYKGNALSPLFGNGYQFAYWSRDDGDKLLDVNFKSEDWRRQFATENNQGADVTISESGSAVFMRVLDESYKRAMWGGFYPGEGVDVDEFEEGLGRALPMETGAKYTMIFDLTLGDNRVAVGVQVDGRNTLLIEGNGQSFWYGWNTICVDATQNGNEKWDQHIANGTTRRDQHTFAVTVDYDTKTMALYVLDENDGCFYFCRSMTYNGADVWDSDYFRCRLYARSMYGTPTEETTARVANLQIYKGDALNHLWNGVYALPYDDHADGDALLKANFNADGWKQSFYDGNDSNHDAVAAVSGDGASVGFTVTSNLYKRAIWGGFYSGEPDGSPADLAYEETLGATLPMKPGAKYTMTFDLTLGDDRVAFGVQVDGRNTLLIEGNGQSFWYGWNTICIDATQNGNEKWSQHIAVRTSKRDTHTFAVTVDYDTKTMALYVLDENDGRFYFCRSMTYDGADVWNSDYFRCRFYVRSMYGTPTANTTATVSDLTIYKGADFFRTANFSVMSYNVEVYNNGLGDRTHKKVLNTVLCEAPDVVGFQEVDAGWNSLLSTFATVGGYTRLTGEYTGKYEFEKNEIFYKTSKFNLVSEGTKTFRQTASELSVPNDEDANPDISNIDRIFHYAVLQEKSSGKKILVVNTHLHYGGTGDGHEEDDKLRRYEIRTLLKWLETQSTAYPDQIVMGDMNSHYKGGQGKVNMTVFEDDGFEMTCKEANVKGDVGGTKVGSARTVRDPWVFDYVLTKGNVGTAYYTVVNNKIDNGGTSYPSDHLPVLTKLIVN